MPYTLLAVRAAAAASGWPGPPSVELAGAWPVAVMVGVVVAVVSGDRNDMTGDELFSAACLLGRRSLGRHTRRAARRQVGRQALAGERARPKRHRECCTTNSCRGWRLLVGCGQRRLQSSPAQSTRASWQVQEAAGEQQCAFVHHWDPYQRAAERHWPGELCESGERQVI